MLRSDAHGRLLNALATFCSSIVNGRFSPEFMRVLTAARFVAVPKPLGGVRPIAVGDILRRLAAKCLHQKVLATVSEYLLPLQVGVKVNAAELVANRVKLWTREANSDEVDVN